MRIYVSYCGGCNPRYDRVKLVEEIAAYLGGTARYDHPERADVRLLVSGCERSCARGREGYAYLTVNEYRPPRLLFG